MCNNHEGDAFAKAVNIWSTPSRLLMVNYTSLTFVNAKVKVSRVYCCALFLLQQVLSTIRQI